MEEHLRELQLLPPPYPPWKSGSSSSNTRSRTVHDQFNSRPSLDLQLSISVQQPCSRKPSECFLAGDSGIDLSGIKTLKWQAAEQIQIAAAEKSYAERVRQMARQEMKLAQSEFARARVLWERAREEVDKAERMKERATKPIDSSCMEITCQACKRRFHSKKSTS